MIKEKQCWYISRQHYWCADEKDAYVVEVAFGGSDFAHADQLVPAWPLLGEGQTFNDPRAAIECAINIVREWRKTERRVKIAIGATGGYTLPFEGKTFKEARAWAKKRYEKLPKCIECGELRDEDHSYGNDFTMCGSDDERYVFCSEQCADRNWCEELHRDCEQGYHRSSKDAINEDETAECEVCGETFSTKE